MVLYPLYNKEDKKRSDSEISIYTPTKEDFNAISIGAVLIIKQIEKQLSERQLALKGYKEDLLPKLQEVLKCETNDEIKGKIDDIFKTND